MKVFFVFIMAIIRLLIMVNIVYLLFVSWKEPSGVEFKKLTWWVYFMVFDIWLEKSVNSNEKNLD